MTVPDDSAWEAPQPLLFPLSAGPTVQRLVLGGQLRRLREEAGLTTERAALSIRGSHSKISRMEHGRVAFKERDIADLLTLYGVGVGEEREALLALAREANTPGWWQGYSDILPHWMEPYFGLEAAASSIREYELQFIPGLLQTEDYARALMRLGNLPSEEEVQRRTQARMSRQEILRRDTPPKLWAVLDEAALRRTIGGPDIMRAQLEHLIEVSDHPAVALQILPFSAGAHRAMGGSFIVMRYAEPDLRDIVFIEQLTSALYLDKPLEVEAYLDVIDEISLQAIPPASTRNFIQQVVREMGAAPAPRPATADSRAAPRDAALDHRQFPSDAGGAGGGADMRVPDGGADTARTERDPVALRVRLAAAAAPARIGAPLDETTLASLRLVVDNLDSSVALAAKYRLGWLYWYQYLSLPQGQDSQALESCVALFTPCFVAGNAELPGPLLSVLAERAIPTAVKLLEQALGSSVPHLISDSVSLWERIVASAPPGDVHSAMWSSNLGVALRVRYERSGDAADLESAIEAGREAVAALPGGHPDRAAAMSDLGGTLLQSYLSMGSEADLDSAIDITATAANSVQVADPERARYLSNLGRVLGVRFERTGDLADLESAIEAGRAAVLALPVNHPDQVFAAVNLKRALSARDGRSGS